MTVSETNTAESGSGDWMHLLSEDGLNLRESEIRALFSVVSRPEVVSLAGGMPNLQDLPLDGIGEMTSKLLRQTVQGPCSMVTDTGGTDCVNRLPKS